MNFNKLTTTGLKDYFRNPGCVIKAPRLRTSAKSYLEVEKLRM